MTEFTHDYYGMDPLVSGIAIHPLAYKELTLLLVFNVLKQSERLVDITVVIVMEERLQKFVEHADPRS